MFWAKRCAILREFQEFFNVKKNKILKLSSTRWLVLHKCVVRLLENWDVLKSFFLLAIVEDKSKFAETISEQLNDDSIKSYFLFLKYSLNFFNNFNALFQLRKILIHKLFEMSHRLIREIGYNFMTSNSLKDITILNIDDEQNLLNVNDIRVRSDCESLLATLSLECAHQIKVKCFYVTAVREMLKRLPYNDTIFKQLAFLEPQIALYNEGRDKIKDLSNIATRIGNIDITKLAYEWTILPAVYNDLEKKELASLEVDEMWKKILEFKDFNDAKMFLNIELLVEAGFPHSNAEAERIFFNRNGRKK